MTTREHEQYRRLRDDCTTYVQGIAAALNQPALHKGDIAAAQMWITSLSARLHALGNVQANPVVHSAAEARRLSLIV